MTEDNLKITHKAPKPTKETLDLKKALEDRGVYVKLESFDGYKHIDIEIPNSKLDIEVDGIHHLTDPEQIIRDLNRGYWSHKDGYNTIHIPNEMIRKYLNEISEALVKVSKMKEHKLHLYTD